MEHVLIRKAEPKDLNILLEFEQGVIQAERPFDITLKPGCINYYDIELMMEADDVELLVAEWNGKIIGSGYVRIENAKSYLQHTHHAYLGFMFVVPEHRGKGVNNKIIDELARWAKEKHITELRLDVYEPNAAALSAYERAGFTKHMVAMRKGLS